MRKTFDKKLLNLTDAELVNKVLSGDKTAECELIHRYYSAIRTTVRFQLGVNHSNWEDIFQDVLIRLLELFRNGKFEPDRGTTVKSFINGVIRKLVLEFRRRENKSGLQSAISIPAKKTDSPAYIELLITEHEQYLQLEKDEQNHFMRQCMKTLNNKHLQVIILRYHHFLSMQKIGEKMACREQQAIDLHRYALRQLRECMKNKLN